MLFCVRGKIEMKFSTKNLSNPVDLEGVTVEGFKIQEADIESLNISSADKEKANWLLKDSAENYVCFTLKLDSLAKLHFEDKRLKSYIRKFLYRNSYFYGKLAEVVFYRFGNVNALATSNMYLGKSAEDSIPNTLFVLVDTDSSFWRDTYSSMFNDFIAYCLSTEVDVDLPNFPEVYVNDPNPFNKTTITKNCFDID